MREPTQDSEFSKPPFIYAAGLRVDALHGEGLWLWHLQVRLDKTSP